MSDHSLGLMAGIEAYHRARHARAMGDPVLEGAEIKLVITSGFKRVRHQADEQTGCYEVALGQPPKPPSNCPNCGAPPAPSATCDYCGSHRG